MHHKYAETTNQSPNDDDASLTQAEQMRVAWRSLSKGDDSKEGREDEEVGLLVDESN